MSMEKQGEMGKYFPASIRLREEIDKLGMTREAVGALIGRDRKTINNYESGRSLPTIDLLIELQERGADVLYILSGEKFSHMGLGEPASVYLEEADSLRALVAALRDGVAAGKIGPPELQAVEVLVRKMAGIPSA